MPTRNDNHLPQCNKPDHECPHGTWIIELRNDMKIVKNALVGDLETGKPGLVDVVRYQGTRIDNLEHIEKRLTATEGTVKDIQKTHKSMTAARKRWMGVAFAAITAFASAAGGWAWVRYFGTPEQRESHKSVP